MTDDISSKFEALSIEFQKPKELNQLFDVVPEQTNKKIQEKKIFDSPLPTTPKKSSYYNLVLTPKRYFLINIMLIFCNINLNRLFSSPSGPALRVPVTQSISSQVPKFDLTQEPLQNDNEQQQEVVNPPNVC